VKTDAEKEENRQKTPEKTQKSKDIETGVREDASQGDENSSLNVGPSDERGEEGQKEELLKTIQALQEENSQLKDQYLRKQADFENFRKRMLKEKEDAIKYANSELLLDLLGIIDDFERAIKSAEDAEEFKSFHEGVVLIEKQFISLLDRKWGLQRFDSEGEEFDPQKHEAINMEESTEHDVATVVEDYQKGYILGDRVLRHAKVKVAMPAGSDSNDTSEE